LQCVIKKFGHSNYKNMENIAYFELSLGMDGDSDECDDEGTDSEFHWPSAAVDHARAMHVAVKDHEVRERDIAEWLTAVAVE
jgi:hypothetical protein